MGGVKRKMTLPSLNENGELPEGVHPASFADVMQQFGVGAAQRVSVAQRLENIHRLAVSSGYLDRFIVFGSFVTDKAEPNDIDVVLVMRDEFELEQCDPAVAVLFDHEMADTNLGASVFWMRPSLLFFDTIDGFIANWQRKRDGTHRGIVEIVP